MLIIAGIGSARWMHQLGIQQESVSASARFRRICYAGKRMPVTMRP